MPDRIVTAAAADGSFSIVAGITTELVQESQRRHRLWPTASAALGRLITGAALLGASLKGRERLTLQISGDGPLSRLVTDAQLVAPDRIGARGHVRRPDVDVPLNPLGKFDVARAVGRGFLQVTRSFEVGQPYVGIVELKSGEIGEDIASYLAISEQIPSVVALGVLANPEGIKAAGGIVAQVLPGANERTISALEERARAMPPVTSAIAQGATPEDLARLLSAGLDVRLGREYSVAFTCTCSRERVETALQGLGGDELRKMARDQAETEAVCEFCRTAFVFSAQDVERLADRLAERSTQSGS
jgi:molecular chaperone Hsp33